MSDTGDLPDEEVLRLLSEAEENWRWIQEQHKWLTQRYSNRYICVQGQKVIATGEDVQAILNKIKLTPDMVCEYIVPHGTAMIL